MSRSRRKRPIFGNANADSEASDKRIWHSRMRHRERQALHSAEDYDAHMTTVRDDPMRDKPRRSGRGRIARTAKASLGFSAVAAAARCTGARWRSAHRRRMRRSRTATTVRLSSSVSGCPGALCAAGDWRPFSQTYPYMIKHTRRYSIRFGAEFLLHRGQFHLHLRTGQCCSLHRLPLRNSQRGRLRPFVRTSQCLQQHLHPGHGNISHLKNPLTSSPAFMPGRMSRANRRAAFSRPRLSALLELMKHLKVGRWHTYEGR